MESYSLTLTFNYDNLEFDRISETFLELLGFDPAFMYVNSNDGVIADDAPFDQNIVQQAVRDRSTKVQEEYAAGFYRYGLPLIESFLLHNKQNFKLTIWRLTLNHPAEVQKSRHKY